MSGEQHIKHKKISTAGWVAITLLLSLFSFSGFAVHPSQQKQIEKTELAIAIRRSVKTPYPFQYPIVASHENRFWFQLESNQLNCSVLHYSLTVRTSLIDALSEVLSFKKSTSFLPSIHNPSPSDEDYFNSLRG